MNENIDFFSHNVIAKSMSKIISRQSLDGSYVIAINGAWGTGKTHLMTSVLSELDDLEYIKVNFNAWRYAAKEDIKRALLICIINECRRYVENDDKRKYLGWNDRDLKIIEQIFDNTERALYTAFVKEIPGEVSINTSNLLKTGINMALKFVPWGNFGNEFIQKFFIQKGSDGNIEETYVEKEDIEELWGIFTKSSTKRNIEKVIGIEQFRKSFELLLRAILEGRYTGDSKNEKLHEHNKKLRLVVAVDDLDRCLPEDALNVLEAIKLFIDYSNTYFMIAMDGNIIQKGLNIKYAEYDSVIIKAKDYYEKMIDLSFTMPALMREKIFSYIQSLSASGSDYIKLFDLLCIALNTNLRAWQRYIYRTDFNKIILNEIAGEENFQNEPILQAYMKLQCFSYQWPEVYRKIYDMETYLLLEQKLEQIANYDKKELEDVLKELEQLGIDKDVRSAIIEKKITDFIRKEPHLNGIEEDKLDIFFTFDGT